VAPSGTVGKAALVLRAFTPFVDVLSVRRLAERKGIPRSSVHELCRALCGEGLLEPVPGGGYRLGPLLVELGGQVIERTGLVAAAEGVAERLRSPDAEVHLGQLVDGWVVYLHRHCGPRGAPMDNRVGLRAPAHLTGCGQAAMALLDADEVGDRVRRLCAEERRPLPDLARLAEDLAEVRRRGYVVCRSFQPGRTSVAAAVRDSSGRPVGGMSVAADTDLLSPARIRRVGAAITAAAAAVSARLAHHGADRLERADTAG
jgi:IclR family acetate operon transcriptional repressor